ncbi:hypothetical protein V3H55_03650 [Klebsiella quasipneumoniae]|uniref:hypothetical protein n=1 Tax=Klebsiella quasipneumoniae TaxID=1463165 RepID=UPI002F268787
MTNNQLTDERLVKILSETQATIMEHNSRCVRGSVEVDARLFESMIMELQERRKAEKDSDDEELESLPLYRHAQQPVVPDYSDPRDAFETVFPMPKHAQRCGGGYAVTSYGAWTAYEFVKKWEGWNACRAAMLAAARRR